MLDELHVEQTTRSFENTRKAPTQLVEAEGAKVGNVEIVLFLFSACSKKGRAVIRVLAGLAKGHARCSIRKWDTCGAQTNNKSRFCCVCVCVSVCLFEEVKFTYELEAYKVVPFN